MSFIAVYITTSGAEEAEHITAYLLEQRLIACANIFPVNSVYRWQGSINREQEFVALVKTRTALWERLKSAVLAIHSYHIPCMMKLEVCANEEYEAWIAQETLDTK